MQGNGRAATPRPPAWTDGRERRLYPLPFPDIAVDPGVHPPGEASFMVWRHLFREGVGAHQRCLDVGCGTGILGVQLALNGASHVRAIDVDKRAVANTLTNAFRNGVDDRLTATVVDLFPWIPEERYEVVVASLHQQPADPAGAVSTHRAVDYWGRQLVDQLISKLADALAPEGVAYVMQLSLLSQQRTAELLDAAGFRAEVVDWSMFGAGAGVRRGRTADRARRGPQRRLPPARRRPRRARRLPPRDHGEAAGAMSDAEERLRVLEAVLEAADRLADAGPVSEIVDRAPAECCRALGLDRCVLSRIDDGALVAEAVHVADGDAAAVLAALREAPVRLGYPLIEAEMLRRRRAAIVPAPEDADAAARHAFAGVMGWGEHLAAPVVLEGRVIGFLHGDRARPRPPARRRRPRRPADDSPLRSPTSSSAPSCAGGCASSARSCARSRAGPTRARASCPTARSTSPSSATRRPATSRSARRAATRRCATCSPAASSTSSSTWSGARRTPTSRVPSSCPRAR